jgi:spore maturation protein B
VSFVLSAISVYFIPAILTIIIVNGLLKKAPVYELFIDGAKDGIQTAIDILPFIIAVFIGIEGITSSGAMDFFQELFSPLLGLLGIPEQLISMIMLRPVSGSGSLALA